MICPRKLVLLLIGMPVLTVQMSLAQNSLGETSAFREAVGWPVCAGPGGIDLDLYTGLAVIFDPGAPVVSAVVQDKDIANAIVLNEKKYIFRNGKYVMEPLDAVAAVYVHGKIEGRVAALFKGSPETGDVRCVLEVKPIAELLADPEKLLSTSCEGPDGDPVVLTVGSSQYLDFKPGFVEVSMSDTTIADVQPVTGSKVVLSGVTTGFSTLTFLGDRGRVLEHCLVHVNE